MLRRIRYLAALALVVWLASSPALPAEQPELAPATEAVEAPDIAPQFQLAPPPATTNPPLAGAPALPGVPYYSFFENADRQTLFTSDLENRGLKLGWFANADVGLVRPFIHSNLSSGTLLSGTFAAPVETPAAQPGFTPMPRFELSYRFEQGLGELRASFRFLSGTGTQTFAGFDAAGAGRVTTRLDVSTIDLDYAATEFLPIRVPKLNPLLMIPGRLGLNIHPEDQPTFPPLLMRWAVGSRLASVYFNSQGTGAATLSERVMNNFVGAGLHTSVEFTRAMPWNPLSFYSRFDVAGMLGDTTQSFSRTALGTGGAISSASANLRDLTLGATVFSVEAGVAYVPSWRNGRCRVASGYMFEQWFDLGDTATSNVTLTFQGLFFRGEWGY